MLIVKKAPVKVSERISNARNAALSKSAQPNQTQKTLEKIYGKSTPEIIKDYTAYNDRWHKYIDI